VKGSEVTAGAGGPFLRVEGLRKVYGSGATAVHALQGIDLEVGAGQFVVLLGPSGSGKTTLLNILGGLDQPTEGQVWVAGEEISAYSEEQRTEYRRRRVGFIFQFFNLVPTLNAVENVELIAELSDRPLPAREVLADLGLGDRADHFPSEMSGGQQQRVAIARALVKNPDLILADEPTGSLDRDAGVTVLQSLQRINREGGRTVIAVSHNVVIGDIADVVLRLGDGRIIDVKHNATPQQASELSW
jgi:putative ABC transport system ATP-binding protein